MSRMAIRNVLVGLGLAALALAGCSHDDKRAAMMLTEAPQFGLFFNDQGESASLAYGEANSDNVALMLQCAKGSGKVQVSDIARSDEPPALLLASGGAKSDLGARVESLEVGPQLLVADTAADTAALKGFRKTGRLTVGQGGDSYGVRASARERAEVDLFFTACGARA